MGYGVLYILAQVAIAVLAAWPFFGTAAVLRLVRLASGPVAQTPEGVEMPPAEPAQAAALRVAIALTALSVGAACLGLLWLTTPVQAAVEVALVVLLLLSRNVPYELAALAPVWMHNLSYRIETNYLLRRLTLVPAPREMPERRDLIEAANRAVRAVPGSLRRLAQVHWHRRRLEQKSISNPHVQEPLAQVRTLISTINARHTTLVDLLKQIEGRLEALAVGSDIEASQLAHECDQLAQQIETIAIATGVVRAELTGFVAEPPAVPASATVTAEVEATDEATPPGQPGGDAT